VRVFGLGVLGAGIVCWVGAWRWDEIGCAGRLGLRGWARGLCAGFQHQTVISNIVIIDYINRNIINIGCWEYLEIRKGGKLGMEFKILVVE
jgi:hypothetical protein